jgi:hypothetical protein
MATDNSAGTIPKRMAQTTASIAAICVLEFHIGRTSANVSGGLGKLATLGKHAFGQSSAAVGRAAADSSEND